MKTGEELMELAMKRGLKVAEKVKERAQNGWYLARYVVTTGLSGKTKLFFKWRRKKLRTRIVDLDVWRQRGAEGARSHVRFSSEIIQFESKGEERDALEYWLRCDRKIELELDKMTENEKQIAFEAAWVGYLAVVNGR